jgi:hypothetical protein
MSPDSDRLAVTIFQIFSGAAEGRFAIMAFVILALATLGCATLYLLRRS